MWTNYLLTRVEKFAPETFATPLGFKLRRYIKLALRPILRLASGRRIHVESYPELEKDVPSLYLPTPLWTILSQIMLLLTEAPTRGLVRRIKWSIILCCMLRGCAVWYL